MAPVPPFVARNNSDQRERAMPSLSFSSLASCLL
jgi:hypothetical protein